jgi:sirohydrochlorin ferrochelatase
LIVSHGSPSDPEPQEDFLAGVAARIAGKLSGTRVLSATLAKEGALERACEKAVRPLIYPWFMTNGWFVSTNLPRRLTKAGCAAFHALPPLGLEPALPACAAAELQGRRETCVVLAAHGSPSDLRPRQATLDFAAALGAAGPIADIRTGFVDEDPSIQDAAQGAGNAVVLPFFAASAGHVLMDMPEALQAAAFQGEVLSPIGTWDSTADLAAESLIRAIRRAA